MCIDIDFVLVCSRAISWAPAPISPLLSASIRLSSTIILLHVSNSYKYLCMYVQFWGVFAAGAAIMYLRSVTNI